MPEGSGFRTSKTRWKKPGWLWGALIFLFMMVGLVNTPAVYASGEVWSSIDADATKGLNYSGSYDGQYPSVALLGNYVYVAWQESNGTSVQIRASRYDKTAGTWSSIDGNGANGLNDDASRNASFPCLAVYSNELYLVWQEDTASGITLIHARKYSGESTWGDIDDLENPNATPSTKGTPCLNFLTNANASAPVLTVYNGKLYAAWSETCNSVQQMRVLRYDGDQVWNFVEKATPDDKGVNYNTNNNAASPGITADNSYLYLTWIEKNGSNYEVRVKKYDGTNWTSCEGSTSPLASYSTVEQSHAPQLAIQNGSLYISWHQTSYNGTYGATPQTKLMKYNGSAWVYVSGNDASGGMNHNRDNNAYNPVITSNSNNLFLLWDEYNDSCVNQIRAISYNNDTRAFIDGDGSAGVNKAAAQIAIQPAAVCDSQFLYAVWYEYNGSKNLVRAKCLTLPAAPTANPAAGSITAGSTVSLSAAGGASIYYTTDGSTPTKNNTAYASPITINNDTTVKAIAVSGGTIASDTLTASYTTGKTATPIASPGAGAVAAGTTVTLTTTTSGASIYYTTDGVTTPTSGSTPYSGPITINAAVTIKAIAIKSSLTNSDVLSASYTIMEKAATPTASVAAGEVAAGTSVTLTSTTAGVTIRYTTDGSTPDGSSPDFASNPLTINANTTVKAIAVKANMTTSDPLTVSYTVKAAAPTASVAAGEVAAGTSVTLTSTTAGATIRYTTDGSTPDGSSPDFASNPLTINANTTVKAIAVKTNMTTSDTLTVSYMVKAATPTASVAAGEVAAGTSVTLTSTTAGATIRYTTDGSTPDGSSPDFASNPLTINANTTVKAIAVKANMTTSDTLTVSYMVKAATPTASVAAGEVAAGTSVTLTSTTAGVTIRYTTDGSTPDGSSPDFASNPLTINANTTVKAIAVKTNMTTSDPLTVSYTVKAAAPTASVAAGEVAAGCTVSLATTTSGATIYYTTDDSIPVSSSAVYSAPLVIDATTTIKAIAAKGGMTTSDTLSASYTIMEKAAAPTASPEAGAVAAGSTVTLATTTSGATIYYTTDDSIPISSSAVYSAPLVINAAATIKAIAAKGGMTTSDTLSASYTIMEKAAAPTASPETGAVAAGSTVTLTTTTSGATIYYTTDDSIPISSSAVYSAPLVINAAATIKAIAAKGGMTTSDTLSASYTIMEKAAAPTASPAAGALAAGSTVSLATATSGATIYYTTDDSIPVSSSAVYSAPLVIDAATTIKAIAAKAGMTTSDTLSASYTIMAKAATPTASPEAGAVAAGSTVTLTTTTSGATIYYTTDDSIPVSSSAVYSAPLVINAAATIKAIAVKADMTTSDTLSASYTIIEKAAAPTASPAAGALAAGSTVSLATATSGATIYYTTDDSIPVSSSAVYSAPLVIDAATTITAIAAKGGMTTSDTLSASYTIIEKAAAPTASPAAGAVAAGSTLTLATTTSGATIYYTTDDSIPISSSAVYSAPIVINAAATIKAIAAKTGMTTSDVLTAQYTILSQPVTSGTINPTTASFDKNPACREDISTLVTWHSATRIIGISNEGASIGNSNYSVSGDTLTIKKEYLSSLTPDTLQLSIEFDAGYPATLSILINDTTPPPVTSASISPPTVGFDKNPANSADVNTAVVWNDASGVTDIKTGTSSIGFENYNVTGDTITISKEYLATRTIGNLYLIVEFDKGLSATLTIQISNSTQPPIVSASISPTTVSFDKNPANSADVSTTVIWNDATGVTDIKTGTASIGAGNYTVSADTLTIKKEYLSSRNIGSLNLTIEFDKGSTANLTIEISNSTPPPEPMPGQLQFTASSYSVSENEGSVTISVTRTGGADGQVSVRYSTSDGTARAGIDYTATSGNLIFGDQETQKSFTIAIISSDSIQTDRTVNITLSEASNGAALGSINTAVLTIKEGPHDYCFIATAAYGSKYAWPVALLRHFRDDYLMKHTWGLAFVNCYYRYSPPIAQYIANKSWSRLLVRFLLLPFVIAVYGVYHLIWVYLLGLGLCCFVAYKRFRAVKVVGF